MTGPWVRLDLVAIRYVRPSDDLAIDDPLGGWCLEARTESGVAFGRSLRSQTTGRRLPPRGLGCAQREDPHRHDVRTLLMAQLIVLGLWKLYELAAMAIVALLR